MGQQLLDYYSLNSILKIQMRFPWPTGAFMFSDRYNHAIMSFSPVVEMEHATRHSLIVDDLS